MYLLYLLLILYGIYKFYYIYIYHLLKINDDNYFLYQIYLLIIYYNTKKEYNRMKNDINIWNISIFYYSEFIHLLSFNDKIKIKQLDKFIKVTKSARKLRLIEYSFKNN